MAPSSWIWRSGFQSSHSPFPGCFVLRGERGPVKTAPFFGAPKGSLDRTSLPADNCGCGEWERTMSESRRFGILLATSPHRSLPGWHVRLPLAPLLSALDRAQWPAARWGPSYWWGAAISAAISRTKTRNAVCPIATVVLYFDASQCPPSPPTQFQNLENGFVSRLRRHRLLTIPQRFVNLPGDP